MLSLPEGSLHTLHTCSAACCLIRTSDVCIRLLGVVVLVLLQLVGLGGDELFATNLRGQGVNVGQSDMHPRELHVRGINIDD